MPTQGAKYLEAKSKSEIFVPARLSVVMDTPLTFSENFVEVNCSEFALARSMQPKFLTRTISFPDLSSKWNESKFSAEIERLLERAVMSLAGSVTWVQKFCGKFIWRRPSPPRVTIRSPLKVLNVSVGLLTLNSSNKMWEAAIVPWPCQVIRSEISYRKV